MRGGRRIVNNGIDAGRGDSITTLGIATFTGTNEGRTFGRPWNPQHVQIPLQLSGAIGWECCAVECCEAAAM
jgi:hypothetical protein